MRESGNKKIPWGKIAKFVGGILMVVSIVFVVRYFLQMEIDFSLILKPEILTSFLIGGVITVFSIFLMSFSWGTILEMFSSNKLSQKRVFSIYGKANLSKYIPGNFMHFAMRNILGKEYEISQRHMALSSVFEVILLVLAGIAWAVLLSWNGLMSVLNNVVADGVVKIEVLYLLGAAVIAVIVVLILYMRKKGYLGSIKPQKLLKSFGIALAALFINALVFFICALAIDYQSAIEYPLMICGYYLIAWLIGFIIPGAPGGLGIREYVMMMLLGSYFDPTSIGLLLVVSRLASVLGDVFTYIFTLILAHKNRRLQNTETVSGKQ